MEVRLLLTVENLTSCGTCNYKTSKKEIKFLQSTSFHSLIFFWFLRLEELYIVYFFNQTILLEGRGIEIGEERDKKKKH